MVKWNGLELEECNIIIAPNNNKLVKLHFENLNDKFGIEKRKPNNREISESIIFSLRNMLAMGIVTTQQYKVEKGKLKRGYVVDVLNFIKKRCV